MSSAFPAKPAFPKIKSSFAAGVQVPEGYGFQPFDISKCEITTDPLPASRINQDGKYTAVLEKLKPGQCVKLPPDQVQKVAKALSKHCQKSNVKNVVVKSCKHYGDGMGRVWLWPVAPK
jgi:hypothetical protein